MKLRSLHIPILLLLATLMLASQCNVTTIRDGMARFDRAFLPVVVYTYEGDMPRAKAQLINLEFQWQRFYQQYGMELEENEDWEETFRRVNDWLGDVYRTIDFNDRELALIQLGHIRYEWMELRKRNDIPYVLDQWYAFDEALSVAVETASDPQLCLLEWYEFELLVADVRTAWNKLPASKTDADLFELGTAEIARMDLIKTEISRRLTELEVEMECADHLEIAAAGQQLQPLLIDVYSIYGKRDASLYHYAYGK